tara:strand:- start:148 stop:501 length:354 start_codon:yes stop_codon:yes gene_type:complete
MDYYVLAQSVMWTVVALLVWFKSDAFVEYAELLGCRKLFGITKYRKAQLQNLVSDYRLFLLLNYNSLPIRLITCPLCTTVWIAIGFAAVHGVDYFPSLVVISYVIYGGAVKLYEEDV